MEPIKFELTPFQATEQTAAVDISGSIVRKQNNLSIDYLLSGDLSSVDIPAPATDRKRCDRLWEKTCFECFIRPANPISSHYWEFNLSPSGDWNVFSLSDYRANLQPEPAIATLPFKTHRSPNQLQLHLSVDISPLIGQQDAHIGISTVLILSGQESYWAITHPAPQADFHHPKSFILHLPG